MTRTVTRPAPTDPLVQLAEALEELQALIDDVMGDGGSSGGEHR